jgi:flagellin-like protein
MIKKKRALSEILSYVLLISITIALSVAVYVWIKDYANVNPVENCKEDTSVIIDSYKCIGNSFLITVKNNGLFNVSGFYLTIGNDTNKAPILNPNLYYSPGNPGYSNFERSLGPGESVETNFEIPSQLREIKVIQIQPFIYNNKHKVIMCSNVLLKQNILGCSY